MVCNFIFYVFIAFLYFNCIHPAIAEPAKLEVIAELKRSVDVGSPSKLRQQQQVQQQQLKEENSHVQITPEQIINKVGTLSCKYIFVD